MARSKNGEAIGPRGRSASARKKLRRLLRTSLKRNRMVSRFLNREPGSVPPHGLIYLSPRLLSFVLLVLSIIKILGMNYMLDALTPGSYANLFSIASYISTAVWFTIAVASLTWYASTLNELKREAGALALLDRQDARGNEIPHHQ